MVNILMDNFFGMNLESQIKFIDNINNDSDIECELVHNFNSIFRNYYKEINYLVFYRSEYSKLDDTLRKYLEMETLKKFSSLVLEHCDYNSDEYVKKEFIDSLSSYTVDNKKELEKYFNCDNISLKEANRSITEFKKLDMGDKNKFLLDLICNYSNLDLVLMPMPDKVVKKYDNIIKELLGEKLYEYYIHLYSKEKILLIYNVCDTLKKIDSDEISFVSNKEIETEYITTSSVCKQKFLNF